MEFVKLGSSYADMDAMMRAGEPAEILYTRALAYCGRVENDGVIPREVLVRLTPLRGSARARALVREGIFEVVPGGWRIHPDWWKQVTKDELDRNRQSARERQAKHRETKRSRHTVTPPVTDGVSHGGVTLTEVEVEVEPAAAAAGRAAAAALPGPVDVLRSKLQAHTPLRGLRFDSLTPDQLGRLDRLLELHGDAPLVRVAIDTCRNPPPVHVGAFLGTWDALPAPGTRLGLVPAGRCDTHDTTLTPAGACTSCAADQKAGNA